MAIANTTKTIKTRVFEVAESRGLRWDWLARQYGLTPSALSRIKNGHNPISRKFMEKSLELFPEKSLADLFYAEDVSELTELVS